MKEIESILLCEWWNLIQQSVDHKSIKIMIRNKLCGKQTLGLYTPKSKILNSFVVLPDGLVLALLIPPHQLMASLARLVLIIMTIELESVGDHPGPPQATNVIQIA